MWDVASATCAQAKRQPHRATVDQTRALASTGAEACHRAQNTYKHVARSVVLFAGFKFCNGLQSHWWIINEHWDWVQVLKIPRTYLVRRTFPEDVSNMRAGHNFKCASAHPGLKGQLQILTTPDIKAGIVGAQSLEELTVDGEEATSHCRRIDRLRCALKRYKE